MLKIGINLTPFVHFNATYKPSTFTLMHLALETELSNIDAIQFYVGSDFPQMNMEDLEAICSHSKKFVNICISMNDPKLTDVIKLNPNMITFCDSLDLESYEVNSLLLDDMPSDVENVIERLKNKGILSCISISPDVRDVKNVAKLEIDYLHLNLKNIHLSTNRNDEIEEFQKLEMTLMAAEKFGFGLSVYGDINTFNVYEYNSYKQIEEVFTGKHLFERSLRVGLSKAIQEYTQLLKNI